jgi:uncharacterized protein
MPGTTSADQIKVIDADTHLTEPPWLWRDALPARWRDSGPRVMEDEIGDERWVIGDRWLGKIGALSVAGTGRKPGRWEEIDPICYEVAPRLTWMDTHGIFAQVLYPNVVALEGHAIMALPDRDLQLAIVRASNDYVAGWSESANGRFVPIAALPFWDIDASILEMERCANLGYTGVVWAATMVKHGLPGTCDSFWDRFYAAAQDMNLSINFHVGVGYTEEQINIASQRPGSVTQDPLTQATDQVRRTALGFLSNGRTICDIIMSGLCERFPRLKFVSVESGFGYIPYLLEALDWQWTNPRHDEHFPSRMLPSEYFRRQIYAMFWFERSTLPLLGDLADNVMFETDFPHDTSLTPGLGSNSPSPAELVRDHIAKYGIDVMRKVLAQTASQLYRLDLDKMAA